MPRPTPALAGGGLIAGLLLILCAGPARADAVDPPRWYGGADLAVWTDSLRVVAGVDRLDLRRSPVVEVLEARLGGAALAPETYTLVVETGVIRLAVPPDRDAWAVFRYRYDPLALESFFTLRDAQRTTTRPRAAIARIPTEAVAPDRSAGSLGALRIQGSKSVSVQSGTNRDATVDQGLNLSIHGRLTESIGVRAEISDENLPITPEGNTEELRDLDQVRIELFGPRGRALLGDFRIARPLGEFLPYERKLQGLDLVARGERGRAEVLAGAPQGRRLEIELRGREGVQGPYELLDGRRLDQSFIVAGSERVWVDGQVATRGEENDYTIDYIRGTVSFTSRRPIGPENRIAIDFETSESGYRRNVVGARVDSLRVGPMRLAVSMLREGDDPDRPRDRSLEDDELQILAAAGDDVEAARSQGVRPTAPGEGEYVFVSDGGDGGYYSLADSNGGDFDVDFLFVGVRQGEYRLDGVDAEGRLAFVWVGTDNGEYAIGRALPLPERLDLASARVEWGDRPEHGMISAEVDWTSYDRNRLSDLDDEDNAGAAWKLRARSPRWFGRGEHGLAVQGVAEGIDARFRSPGRIREPFFYEKWNLEGEARAEDEEHQEVSAVWSDSMRAADVGFERLRRGQIYEGSRWRSQGRGRVVGPLAWDHRFAQLTSDREGAAGDRLDRNLRLRTESSGWNPFIELGDERFRDRRSSGTRGYRSEYWSAGLLRGAGSRLSFRRELADSLRAVDESWSFARDTRQWKARTGLGNERARADVDLTWRRTFLPDELEETTRLARLQGTLRAPSQGLSIDVEYRAGTDQSRVLGRQLVFVGLGEGDYDAEGVPVGVRQGDYDLVFTPSDSLVRSTEVGLTVRVDLSPPTDWLGGFSHRLLWQVEERSRTDEVGRLLRLDPGVLRDPDQSVFGEQRFRDELALLRRVRDWDARINWESRRTLDQRYTQGPESVARDRVELRVEHEIVKGWTLRADLAAEDRSRESVSDENPLLRSYDVRDAEAKAAVRWRRDTRSRAEVEVGGLRRREDLAGLEQNAIELVPTLSQSLFGARWTLQGRLARVEETGGSDLARPIFFERPGTQRGASLVVQWGGAGTLSVSFRYQLRDEPGRDLRQDLGLETRARF